MTSLEGEVFWKSGT